MGFYETPKFDVEIFPIIPAISTTPYQLPSVEILKSRIYSIIEASLRKVVVLPHMEDISFSGGTPFDFEWFNNLLNEDHVW